MLMSSKSKDILVVFLSVVLFLALVSVIVLGITRKNKESQELIKEAEESSKVVTATAKSEEPKDIVNPYEKIKNKKSVSMLILGDYIAQSQGVEEKNKWSSVVLDLVDKNYGIKPTINLLANKDQGILKTLEDYTAKESTKKYDFVIICVGADDAGVLKIEQFRKNYEALVRKIKEGNENSEVISIIESSIKINKTYPDEIKSICDYYEIPYVDGREVFKQSNIEYSKLTLQDGQTPNADGYKLYGDAIYNVIKTNTDKGKVVKALNKGLLYAN